MTYDEYAANVGKRLLRAHNEKRRTDTLEIFKEADNRLRVGCASVDKKRVFWRKARESFNSGPFRLEDQANSSLHALMQLIQNNLTIRTDGK